MTDNITNKQWQDINKMYPYGEFPTRYTKKYKEADINNPNIFNYHNSQNNGSDNVSALGTPPNPSNNMDMSKILPIIASIKDNKGMKSQDMLNLMLPLLLGNKSKDFGALLKLLAPSEKKVESQQNIVTSTSLTPPKYPSIDSFRRID